MIEKFDESAVFRLLLADVEVGGKVEAPVGLGGLRSVAETQGQDFGPATL